jgi:hypothetical protein
MDENERWPEHTHATCVYAVPCQVDLAGGTRAQCKLRGKVRSVDPRYCESCGHWLGPVGGEREVKHGG